MKFGKLFQVKNNKDILKGTDILYFEKKPTYQI